MQDPNLVTFYERVGRIQKARAAGMGFEAVGTLGRSCARRPVRKRRLGFLLPLLFVAAALWGLKGAVHYHVGEVLYAQRVDAMRKGEGFDRLGALVMMPDPITRWISGRIGYYLNGKAHVFLAPVRGE